MSDLTLKRLDGGLFCAGFSAMASPCEVLIETTDADLALAAGQWAQTEASRIEAKFSRYRADSIVSQINQSQGHPIELDEETAQLIDFAKQCHALSDGRFDITSGVLRRVWRFDGSDRIPSQEAVSAIRPLIGFQHLDWQRPTLRMPAGMEIDLGGLGKEYAVDRVLSLLDQRLGVPVLVNFGGDLAANQSPKRGLWQVGIERPDEIDQAALVLELSCGGLATSGDTRRFLLKDGVRYGHILNPHSGWPVMGGPRSVTVAASTCMEAGMLATFSLLHGDQATAFLEGQGVSFWVVR
ncbi:MAG TPA: FAD:protein FMN transferase [Aquabacterium sp.]|nr:FAD:protein FMN transferase [Aquabacterium sp.]